MSSVTFLFDKNIPLKHPDFSSVWGHCLQCSLAWEGFWKIFDFLAKQADFFYTKGGTLAKLTFLMFIVELSFKVFRHWILWLFVGPPVWCPIKWNHPQSSVHIHFLNVHTFLFPFPSFLMIFKTALVSIIFIQELSVLHKSCLEFKFQALLNISRVPCTPVFLRSSISGL